MTRSNIPPEIRRCAMWCHLLNLNLIWIVMAISTITVISPWLDIYNGSLILAILILPLLSLLISRTLALVFWRTHRHRHPFINESGKEALNFSLSSDLCVLIICTILFASCGFYPSALPLLNFIGFTWVLVPLLLFTHFCLTIFGSIRANMGEIYKYPYTIRFLGN